MDDFRCIVCGKTAGSCSSGFVSCCTHCDHRPSLTETVAKAIDGNWGEPAPKPNTGVPVHVLVMKDIASRLEFGVRKYGTPLQANNGRDALKDAYEEALDLCCYLRQALEERDAATRT